MTMLFFSIIWPPKSWKHKKNIALKQPEIGSTVSNSPVDNNRADEELHFRMPGGSGYYKFEGDESDKRNGIPTISQQWEAATELKRFELQTSDVHGYEGEDADNADADKEDEASQAVDGSMQNVADWGHSRLDDGTSDVDGEEGKDCDDADADEEEEASQVDDGLTQNVQDKGHTDRGCEDWTVYLRPVKYDNGDANAMVNDASQVNTEF